MSKEMRATILNNKILIKPVNSYIFTKYNIKKKCTLHLFKRFVIQISISCSYF